MQNKGIRAFVIMAITFAIAACSLFGAATHSPAELRSESGSCAALCNSHGGQLPISNILKEPEDKDDEPVPPTPFVVDLDFPAWTVYLLPLAAIGSIVYFNKRFLLSTQLRF